MKNIETLASRTRKIIREYDFNFKKNFGQNFIIDERVISKIIKAAQISENDTVMEIGPGTGTLTTEIAKNAKKVLAVEIDRTLIPILRNTLGEYKNVEIINEDILKMDINEIARGYENFKIAANLPYYITTPVIMNILENNIPVKNMTVMIQKEVADRMKAKPSTKEYGSLSIVTQYFCEPYLAANVPRNCFIPRPNVDSSVICLKPREKPPVDVKDKDKFFKFIRAAFSMRRKTLVNCISSNEKFNLTKEEISNVIKNAGYDERIRGENLSIQDFAKIFNSICV